MSELSAKLERLLGRTGVVGAGVLVACAAFWFAGVQRAEREAANLRAELARTAAQPRAAAGVAVGTPAAAALLTFEDLPGTISPLSPVPSGYGGLLWNGPEQLYSIKGSYLPGTGYAVASTSGSIVVGPAFAEAPSVIRMSGPGSFDFLGSWFTAAYDDQSLSFTGKLGGVTRYASSLHSISTTGPVHLAFSWTGIDELIIGNTFSGSQWAMDDFEYTLHTPPPAVPLPPAIVLFASGLALLTQHRRALAA